MRGACTLGFVMLASFARAQEQVPQADGPNTGWQRYDWLKPEDDQQHQADSGESFSATAGQNIKDPFSVLSTGALWQENYDAAYTRRVGDTLSLSCETSAVTLSDTSEDLSRSQKLSLQFQPFGDLTLRCNLHDSMSDAPVPSESVVTSGAAFSMDSHLPFNSVLSLGVNADSTGLDTPARPTTNTNTYNAQLSQPLGKVPLTAVLKGSYTATSTTGGTASSLPSLEQSLVWKPLQETTVQMGLRQQQYQEYPGVDNLLNEAIFADWSQTIAGDLKWHSYAEVLNSRGLVDQAPAAPIASGANGTPQATVPGSNASVTSSLPISLEDQTLTFSTGPSFQIEKDISASIEYSNRWDKNPAPGGMGDEQRVSVSLKGSF